MGTLKQEFIFFNDGVGRVIGGASMEFYDADAPTTQKDTYTTKSLANKNPWPLVADAAGRFPVAWLATGGYRIVVKDGDGVIIEDRDDINVSETTILSTSDFYFSTLIDAKQGISINGSSINLQEGQVAVTVGKSTTTDGLGAQYLVVAGGTGTVDDDLFVDLDNGLQLQKLRNQMPWTFNDYDPTGTVDAIILTRKAENPKNIAYNTDQRYRWVATGDNTGAVTVEVDGLSVKDVVHPDGSALVASDILADQDLEVKYDGTNMVLLSGYSRKESEVALPVSGYTGTRTRYIKNSFSTLLSVGISFPTTVGPTGSGAAYIWADLDDIPLDASSVIIVGGADLLSATADPDVSVRAAFGGVEVVNSRVRSDTGDLTGLQATALCDVPVDGDNVFTADVTVSGGGSGSDSMLLQLVGFNR